MADRQPVTVIIERFEDLVARGLRSFVDEDPNLKIVAVDVPHENLSRAIHHHRPAVAVLNFGSLSSALEIQALTDRMPETRLVVLASHPSLQESSQMLAFGATACLSKDTQARDVLNAIHLASRGLRVLPRTAADVAPDVPGPELLTQRESEVLEHLREGRTNAEIALTLHVGVETVRTHARNIYRKLGVRGRRDLVVPRRPGRSHG